MLIDTTKLIPEFKAGLDALLAACSALGVEKRINFLSDFLVIFS
jgi:hypothetical protein